MCVCVCPCCLLCTRLLTASLVQNMSKHVCKIALHELEGFVFLSEGERGREGERKREGGRQLVCVHLCVLLV